MRWQAVDADGLVQDEAAHKTLQKIVGETDGIRQVLIA